MPGIPDHADCEGLGTSFKQTRVAMFCYLGIPKLALKNTFNRKKCCLRNVCHWAGACSTGTHTVISIHSRSGFRPSSYIAKQARSGFRPSAT